MLAYETLMKIGCCLIFLFVKATCAYLDSLSFIRNFLGGPDGDFVYSLLQFSGWTFNISPIAITAVSSANVAMVLFDVVDTSLI
jgi:hypothetical protein